MHARRMYQPAAQQIKSRPAESRQDDETNPGRPRELRVQQTYRRIARGKHQCAQRIITGLEIKTLFAKRPIVWKQPQRRDLYRIEPRAATDFSTPEPPRTRGRLRMPGPSGLLPLALRQAKE